MFLLVLDPDPSVTRHIQLPYNPATSFNNQNLKVSVEALNVSAIASLNLPVITFYGGVGYCKTRTMMDFSGNFPLPVLVTPSAVHLMQNIITLVSKKVLIFRIWILRIFPV